MKLSRTARIVTWLAWTLVGGPALLSAQPAVELCRSPEVPFGGAGGTPVAIDDSMEVTQPVTVGELLVEVRITHDWVGDIVMEITSPGGTTLRLHDGNGGNADHLDLVFSDHGVPNAAEPYDFGCYMQPAGDGGVGTMSGFDLENGQGTWTLDVLDDYPSGDDGVLERWCLRIYEIEPAPPPEPVANLTCTPTPDGAVLGWANGATYDGIDVFIDDEPVAALPGSANAHTVTERPPGVPLHVTVRGVVEGSLPSCFTSCDVTPLGPLPIALTERLVLVVVDGLRYSEGLGDPLRQHVPNMDFLAAKGTIVEPMLNDGPTVTARGIPAIMNGSWEAPVSFFDPECQEQNQHSAVPYVHEYFRSQLDRSAEDCVYVVGPYCPWRGSFHPSYGESYWPLSIATAGGDDANWQAAQQVLETLQPAFLTLYLPDVDTAGHSGSWDAYILAIERADAILGELWDWLQQDPLYSGRTTVIVTNDHGRHSYNFRGHGDDCTGCRTIQLLAVGPGIKAHHVSNIERTIPDIAPTIGALLGVHTEYATGTVMTEVLEIGICTPPDETVYIYDVGLTDDGNDHPILSFVDPHPSGEVTGYDIYRSSGAGQAHDQWPRLAHDVGDMDELQPNQQWSDTTGDVPPSGIWYYQVAAHNHDCPAYAAEGPW